MTKAEVTRVERIATDLLVIGAGSGGLSVAAGAARMGAQVVLLEAAEMGGDCLNTGCVPSKALLAAARVARTQARAAAFGIADAVPQVDFAALREHVAGTIARIAPADSQARFEGMGVRVIRARGRFVSPREVAAGGLRIVARRIVIATGSAPAVPPVPGLGEVPFLTSDTLFALAERPDHLLIVGGGPVGLEMAQAHRRLGCRVTVIEGGRILGREDPEAVAVLRAGLRDEGVELIEGTAVARVAGRAGAVTAETGDGRVFRGTHLLVAAGRRPRTEGLNLEAAGIAATEAGIRVDDRLRTTNRRVHAIGDVADLADGAGAGRFTHVAGYHATVILRTVLFGLPARLRSGHLPHVVYTEPELARIGPTEAEARARHGARLEVVRTDFADNDRAVAERRTAGFVKLLVVRGRPVGVTIVGHQAAEQAGLWSLVLANRMKMAQLAAMVPAYPTIAEVNKRVAGAYFSPRLFDSPVVRRVVGAVQRWLP